MPSEAALLPGHPGHLRGDDGGRTAGRRKVQTRGLQVSTPVLFSLSSKSGHNILGGFFAGFSDPYSFDADPDPGF